MVNPLFTLDVVECLYWSILAENSFGRLPIVHLGSSNSASFYEIAREILNLEGLKNPISGVFSPRGCKYPLNGVLKLSLDHHLVVPTWQESLQRYFINEPEAA
jgi:dTDP-4-dehydrorhamnose reductase